MSRSQGAIFVLIHSTRRFETITGTIQFGNSFDDWGNRFLCHQSQPIFHEVLPQHYLARNPHLPVPSAINNMADDGPVPIFRISPTERWRQIRSNRLIANELRDASQSDVSQYVIDAAAGVTSIAGPPTQAVLRQRVHRRCAEQPGSPADSHSGRADV